MSLTSMARAVCPASLRPLGSWVLHRIRGAAYAGRAVECPCCGGWFRHYLPAPGGRPGALCPGCGSLERHRLQWLYLQRETDFLRAHLRVLQVSPDAALEPLFRRLPGIERVQIDLGSPRREERINVTEMPFPSGSFDVVLCGHVLEHVPDDHGALQEIYRVLRPGGWGLILSYVDPRREDTLEDDSVISPRERKRLFDQEDHVRIYGRDYADRLREAGFSVEVVPYAEQIGPSLAARHGLIADPLYLCRKPSRRPDPGPNAPVNAHREMRGIAARV